MQALHEALPPQQRGSWFASAEAMAERVPRLVDAGDVAMVKGSNGSRVGLVVKALKALGTARALTGATAVADADASPFPAAGTRPTRDAVPAHEV